MSDGQRRALVSVAEIEAMPETRVCHPLNPDSEVYTRRLSDLVGMRRAQLAVTRLPPGRESFIYHFHRNEEEFLYVLSGRGRARIGDETFEVGPGDFMGFSAPSESHHLANPFHEDLVYLMGGERREFGITEFPEIGVRNIKDGSEMYLVAIDAMEVKYPEDWTPDS